MYRERFLPFLRMLTLFAVGLMIPGLLAVAGLGAVLSDPRFAGQHWDQTEGQWWFAVQVAVAGTHLAWIIAWLMVGPIGRIRFLNAALLLPGALVMTFFAINAGHDVASKIPTGTTSVSNSGNRLVIVGICVVLTFAAIVVIAGVLLRRNTFGEDRALTRPSAD